MVDGPNAGTEIEHEDPDIQEFDDEQSLRWYEKMGDARRDPYGYEERKKSGPWKKKFNRVRAIIVEDKE